jgi:hypothetical protein
MIRPIPMRFPSIQALLSAARLAGVVALLLSAQVQAAQVALPSAAVSSGGGLSEGMGAEGSYSLLGSVAAPAAAPLAAGGVFELRGGFFAHFNALQQAGAPRLRLRAGNPVGIEAVWPASTSSAWVLQYNATNNLAPGGWVDVTQPPHLDGEDQFHAFESLGIQVFFRLRRR